MAKKKKDAPRGAGQGTSRTPARMPGGPAEERFTGGALAAIRAEIEEAGGCEVFFRGLCDGEGKVAEAEPLARGNRQAVPSLEGGLSPGEVVVHNHPDGFLIPSEADLAAASRLGAEGVGFLIVDNGVTRVYAVVEPSPPPPPPEPLDGKEVRAFFAAGGSLSSVHPQYEMRPSQAEMAEEVASVLDGGRVGVFEAGTGTGKSLAYLLPSVLWALRGGRRVVVSTHTITLQEQQLRQDLPLLQAALGEPFSAALVKGRGNYLCLRKRGLLESEEGDTLLDIPDLSEVRDLLAWSRATADGSLSDLSFVPRDANWDLFRSESDSCLRSRCPHFSTCFFYRARRAASGSRILLANHHILFADLSLRAAGGEAAALMPRYDAVILDEAHNVEDVALSFFDAGIGRWAAVSLLGRLVSRRKPDRGLAPFLVRRLSSLPGLTDAERAALLDEARALAARVQEDRPRMEALFGRLAETLVGWLGREGRFRIPPERRRERGWGEAAEAMEHLAESARSVLGGARRVARLLREQVDAGAEELAGPLGDLSGVAARLEGNAGLLDRMLEGEGEEEVFWVEVRTRGARPAVNLHLTPLDAAGILERTLLALASPAVFTSATLTVGSSFAFVKERLGIDRLPDTRVRERVFPSPFDFARQMGFFVVDDLPEPEGNSSPGLEGAVEDLVAAAGGGALVLFTSYRSLDAVFAACEPLLRERGITCLRQGEQPRTRLLERFRADVDSVLFATDSFWEGIDVMGEALRCVIIARLPFDVPTDPVMEARRESFVRQGRDPFREDALPRAVIRFRQGVGRLIRHREDRGCVVVCDVRVLRRFYGPLFLSSLPGVSPRVGGLAMVALQVERFLAALVPSPAN